MHSIKHFLQTNKEQLILKQYAKNFLPILFNIYTESKESTRLYVIETIRTYLPLADMEVVTVAIIQDIINHMK